MIRLARASDGALLEMARPGVTGTVVAHVDIGGQLTHTLCGLTEGPWERPGPDAQQCPRCSIRVALLLASTPPRRLKAAA